MWNWIGMHARLYWLSQIHFHFLKFNFNYLEITFTFFSNLLSLVRNSFSQTGHIIWGGEEQILLAIQLICSSCHFSTWPEPKTFFNSSLDLQYQPKMHVQTDLMKCVWYLGVESNFQYHSLTSRESNLWWVWMKTSNWVLFPRSWMALKLCQCKSEMAKTLCIWDKSPASLRIKWVGSNLKWVSVYERIRIVRLNTPSVPSPQWNEGKALNSYSAIKLWL